MTQGVKGKGVAPKPAKMAVPSGHEHLLTSKHFGGKMTPEKPSGPSDGLSSDIENMGKGFVS